MERITNQQMTQTVLDNNQRTLARIATYQDQLSSQKRFQKVSDDPVASRIAMRLRADLGKSDDWTGNIDNSLSFLSTTDSTLGEMSQAMTQVKQAAVEGSSGHQDAASRAALAQSVDALLSRMVDLGNGVHDGRYLFGGTATNGSQPFARNAADSAVDYRGNLDTFQVQIGPSITVPVNHDGQSLFKEPTDVFQPLVDLRNALKEGDPAKITALMGSIDAAQSQIDQVRAGVGGRVARLELGRNQLEASKVQLQGLLSDQEDVDLTQVITQLNQAQVALEAGMQAGTRVLQPSLLDFLR